MTNEQHTVLYTGVTSNLRIRAWQHKNKTYPQSFTAKYNCNILVYYFFYSRIEEAIAAEKLIKGGSKQSKINLVASINPEWRNLYDDIME